MNHKIRKQLLFAVRDISGHVGRYLIFLIQAIAIVLLIGYSSMVAIPQYKFWQKTNSLHDKLENSWFLTGSDVMAELVGGRALEEEIRLLTQDQCFSFSKSGISLNELPVVNEAALERAENGTVFYPVLYITEYLQTYFEWNCESGRFLTKDEVFNSAHTKDGYIPMLLGAAYAGKMNLGDVVDDKYQVVGILKSDCFWMNPKWEGTVYWLNDLVILPMSEECVPMSDAFLNQLYCVGTQEMVDRVQEAYRRFNSTGYFRSMSDQIETIMRDCVRLVGICVWLSGLLFLLALVSMAAMTAQMIQNRKQELTIHLLYGAGTWLFQIRFFVPFSVIFLVSWATAAAIFSDILTFWPVLVGILLMLYGMIMAQLRIVKESCLAQLMLENAAD